MTPSVIQMASTNFRLFQEIGLFLLVVLNYLIQSNENDVRVFDEDKSQNVCQTLLRATLLNFIHNLNQEPLNLKMA